MTIHSDTRLIQKKICLLGDFAVGKTSLVRRFVEDRFDDKYLSTIGVKVSRKSLAYDTGSLNLLIWDLAGGDDYAGAGQIYLRGAVGAMIVFDLSRMDTMDKLTQYTDQLRAMTPEVVFVFVANKMDLVPDLDALAAAHQERLDQLPGPVVFASARSGEHVAEAFTLLADQLRGQL